VLAAVSGEKLSQRSFKSNLSGVRDAWRAGSICDGDYGVISLNVTPLIALPGLSWTIARIETVA
jgi:hypothetical protein